MEEVNLATIANGPIAEIPAKPLRLAALLGCKSDERLAGVRIAPGPGGAGVRLEAITAQRLVRIESEEGEASTEVVLPVMPLRMMLQRHSDADFVGVAAVADEGLLQIRSYSESMTIAIQAPEVRAFPSLPTMLAPELAVEAEPCWLSLAELAQTLVIFRRFCPDVALLPQAQPHPLLMRLQGAGFKAEVHLARLER